MIKVIVGYRTKQTTQIPVILLKIRETAINYPGFVMSEILLSDSDVSLVVVEDTWDRIEDWRQWLQSTLTQSLLQEAQRFLLEEPRVTIYRTMPTEKINPSSS